VFHINVEQKKGQTTGLLGVIDLIRKTGGTNMSGRKGRTKRQKGNNHGCQGNSTHQGKVKSCNPKNSLKGGKGGAGGTPGPNITLGFKGGGLITFPKGVPLA